MSNKEPLINTTPQVLIVEDSLLCQQMYISLLKDSFSLELVGTANEAIPCFSKQAYQCIILDLGLPDKSGEELLPIIRNSSFNKDTPIIVISAHVNETLKQQCLLLGANEVYVKSMLPTMFRSMIENFAD